MRPTVVDDVGRVEAREHEVSGFAGRHGNLHRLGIAHLADDDDVGRLPERGAERRGEVRRVDADLHLLDQALADAGARTRSDLRW